MSQSSLCGALVLSAASKMDSHDFVCVCLRNKDSAEVGSDLLLPTGMFLTYVYTYAPVSWAPQGPLYT